MKWLLVAVLLSIPLLSLWARLRPRSQIGRAARLAREPKDSLRGMGRRQLARGGVVFVLFAAAAIAISAAMVHSSLHRGWPSFDSPFVAALAGASLTVGGLSLLIGVYLLAAAVMTSRRGPRSTER